MRLKQLFLTQNDCYKAGVRHTVKGIMVHSTGANNPDLKRYVAPDDGLLGKNQYGNHWNTAKPGGSQICVHAFIGRLANGTIATYQTLPWDMVGWHSGQGNILTAQNNGFTRNSANQLGYVGFEICEDGLTDKAYFDKVYTEAVEVCVMLCKQYGIKPDKPFIIDHAEGNKLGIASGHADVGHWFPKFGKSMNMFRLDVKAALSGSATPPVTPPAIAPYDVNIVRVTTETLNIRKEAGTNFDTVGSIKKGECYTIVAESTGIGAKLWGKLKSGAGWIALDYTEKR